MQAVPKGLREEIRNGVLVTKVRLVVIVQCSHFKLNDTRI